MNNNQFIFSDPAPYPSIEVCEKNRMYAKAMLANVGSCNSEMSAVSLYFYNTKAEVDKLLKVLKNSKNIFKTVI